jgi:hypothetical protein
VPAFVIRCAEAGGAVAAGVVNHRQQVDALDEAVRRSKERRRLSSCKERIPPFTALTRRFASRSHSRTLRVLGTGVNPTTIRNMMSTEAASTAHFSCTISGLRDPERSRHPSRTAVVSRHEITPSPPAGIGVTAVWPRHRLVMPTGRQPANIPTQRCGAVGSLAVCGEEEVTE